MNDKIIKLIAKKEASIKAQREEADKSLWQNNIPKYHYFSGLAQANEATVIELKNLIAKEGR